MNILVTGARAPIAADLAKAFRVAGHRVWLADSLRWAVASGSPYAESYLHLPAPRRDWDGFVATLIRECTRHAIDAIVPTSEEVFWLAAVRPRLPQSVNLRTSQLELLKQFHDKAAFASLATKLGYGAPENHVLHSRAELVQMRDPQNWVFKPVYSRFATQTLIGPKVEELQAIAPTLERPWLAQTRIVGREVCLYNVADRGRLLLHVAYEPAVRFGKGASIYFSETDDEALRRMAADFVEHTQFTGQISFDVIAGENGLVAIECNPRGTSGVHLAAQSPAVLAAALLGQGTALQTLSTEPRMLLGPWLLQSPGMIFRARDRALWARARDALCSAKIGWTQQLAAMAEMSWLALRARTSVAVVSTADIEWNGERMND